MSCDALLQKIKGLHDQTRQELKILQSSRQSGAELLKRSLAGEAVGEVSDVDGCLYDIEQYREWAHSSVFGRMNVTLAMLSIKPETIDNAAAKFIGYAEEIQSTYIPLSRPVLDALKSSQALNALPDGQKFIGNFRARLATHLQTVQALADACLELKPFLLINNAQDPGVVGQGR